MQSLKLTTQEIIILITVPFIICVATTIKINFKPIYHVTGKVTLVEPPLHRLNSAITRNMDKSVGRIIRRAHRKSRAQSIMRAEENLAILKSRELLANFINDRNIKPKLFVNRWDEHSGTWKKRERSLLANLRSTLLNFGRPRKKKSNSYEPTDALAVKLFKIAFSAKRSKQSGVITLSLRWQNPEDGALILNELIVYANEYIANRAQEDNKSMISKLEKKLSQTSEPRLRKILFNRIEILQSEKILKSVELAPAFKTIDEAIPPLKPMLRIPKKRLLIVFVMSFAFTGLLLIHRRFKQMTLSDSNPKDKTPVPANALG